MKNCFVAFQSNVEGIEIPNQLNNPFGKEVPVISQIAAKELQAYIALNEKNWAHNFGFDDSVVQGVKGKMFGVLVVRNTSGKLGYLATFSGKLLKEDELGNFVPSVFNPAVDDFFINKGMSALTQISSEIKKLENQFGTTQKEDIAALKLKRKNKSNQLQTQLFSNYYFTNLKGKTENLISIFANTPNKRPAAGTGECAAPKLLEYAIQNKFTPIALTEFWWGRSPKTVTRQHKSHYPACQNKCRHLLEYMLNDFDLFENALN